MQEEKAILEQEKKRYQQENQKLRKMWSVPENIERLDDPYNLGLMHMIEAHDGTINNQKKIHAVTGLSRTQFSFIYDLFTKTSKQREPGAPLFVEDKYSDPGNRCKLHRRHTVLLTLMHLRLATPQAALGVLFGIDQSTVSRYLDFSIDVFSELLPTSAKITQKIRKCNTIKELKKLVPDGTAIVDGSHVNIHRPQDPKQRTESYSGKRKDFTRTITFVTNSKGLILYTSSSQVGSTHDITMVKDGNAMDFGKKLNASMRDPDTPKNKKMTIYADLGYLGIQKMLAGTNIKIPAKKQKGSDGLTLKQRRENKKVNRTRIIIEHAIGRVKQYRIVRGPYNGTAQQLDAKINVVCGLVNLKLLWDYVRDKPNLEILN